MTHPHCAWVVHYRADLSKYKRNSLVDLLEDLHLGGGLSPAWHLSWSRPTSRRRWTTPASARRVPRQGGCIVVVVEPRLELALLGEAKGCSSQEENLCCLTYNWVEQETEQI